MSDARHLISVAMSSLFVLGITASVNIAHAEDEEKCFGVVKAGQNACNSNKSQHSCAGHSKIDNDPNDYITLPQGSCLKIGGTLEPANSQATTAGKG